MQRRSKACLIKLSKSNTISPWKSDTCSGTGSVSAWRDLKIEDYFQIYILLKVGNSYLEVTTNLLRIRKLVTTNLNFSNGIRVHTPIFDISFRWWSGVINVINWKYFTVIFERIIFLSSVWLESLDGLY